MKRLKMIYIMNNVDWNIVPAKPKLINAGRRIKLRRIMKIDNIIIIDKYIPIKPRELNHWNLKNIMQ